ncbi:MAG: hypothetical protein OEM03_02845 [Chromatiales bacterium]|nr:hypothetical protein [Chromatiales bacterium]
MITRTDTLIRSRWTTGFILLLASFLLSACVSEKVRVVNKTQALQAQEEIPESLLLDVGIRVFDPGIPEDESSWEKENVYPAVRRAESRYVPYTLKDTMQRTAQWGSIWVVPRDSNAVDVSVSGEVLVSDGETLALRVHVVDSTGRLWLEKEYSGAASKYSYNDELKLALDPFQNIYNQIANDMVGARQRLSDKDIESIRTVSSLKFATEFSPDAFETYLARDRKGNLTVNRLPAPDDPMMGRMFQIRDREYMLFDVLDEHYGNFHQSMDGPYENWRKYSYEETIARREVAESATRRKLLGAAAIIGGLIASQNSNSSAASTVSTAAVLGGIAAFKSGMDRAAETRIHEDALKELATSLEAEVKPMVVEVEGNTVELTGSAEAQYEEWRQILQQIYEAETGFTLPPISDEGG